MLANTELSRQLPHLIDPTTSKDLSVRPASIDLSVGRIVVPPESDRHDPELTLSYVIPVGGTLVVETTEKLNIPADHGGLMFPKSSALAEKGVLITNFGCVDPGYSGHLKFVIINLGRKPFGIRQGDRVVTLVLFRLTNTASPDYQEYKKGRPSQLSSEETSRLLSHDFVDVARRAAEEARITVQKSALGYSMALSLALIVPSIFISLAPPFLAAWTSFGAEDARIDRLELSLQAKILNLSNDLAEVRQLASQGRD